MGFINNVQKIAEESSDTIPEIQQLAIQLQTVSTQVSDSIPEIQSTVAEVNSLATSIRKLLPFAIVCLCIMAIAGIGTLAGIILLLLK